MNLILAVFAGMLAALPETVFAQIANPCPIPILPCGNGGMAGASMYAITVIAPALRLGFIALGIGMFLYYAVLLLLNSGESNTVDETRGAYEYGIFGAAYVSLASFIVESFNRPDVIIDPVPVTNALTNIILGIKILLSTIITLHITIQAFRLVLSEVREGEQEKVKKRFLHGLLGVGMILLANPIIEGVQPGANSAVLADETVGAANFLLSIFGALFVLSFIAAGAMLIFSVDEGLKDKAKKAMSNAVIALVVILVSYVIVNFFLAL
jgi:hypothetical protein